jgi:hypothetical protein
MLSNKLLLFNMTFIIEQLWKPPELQSALSNNNLNLIYPGTQKGDIYSFGIIVQEILYRKGVFHLTDEDKELYFKNEQIPIFNDKKWYYKGKYLENHFIKKYIL